jgi:hypothetical protein
MALKGNLRDFNLTQLLNLVSVARKSGTLVVEDGPQQALLFFREGKLVCARTGQADGGLLDVLERSRRISSAQARLLKQRHRGMTEQELGLMLVNASYITQQEALASLQAHFLEVVNELFGWREGQFRFENDRLPPEGAITLRIGLDDLILDGSRRQQEAQQLLEEIPSLDMALKFVERPGTDIRQLKLSREEWRVVRYVNPKNSLRQIARTLKMSDMEIRRTAYTLLQASLVELVRPLTPEVSMLAQHPAPVTVPVRQAVSAAVPARKTTPAPFATPLGQPVPAMAGAAPAFLARPKPAPVAASQPSKRERVSLIGKLINRIKAL